MTKGADGSKASYQIKPLFKTAQWPQFFSSKELTSE
jgi:hypothetical protein